MGSLVTVCISTFNRSDLLPRAVSSVRSQTYKNLEIIIVDDCSTDNTEEVANNLSAQDERIVYIRHSTNKGLAASRNSAINAARGEYFTFVDDDDEWDSRYVEEFVKVAADYNPDWCFCCGSVRQDILGQTLHTRAAAMNGPLLEYVTNGYTPPVTSQFYFLETVRKVDGYNEKVKSGVDHDLWLKLAFCGVKIKSLDLLLSRPSDPLAIQHEKMTNNFDKRIHGISNSLLIWKDSLVEHCGEDFYQQFADAYLLREYKKFFRMHLLRFEFSQALRLHQQLIGSSLPVKEIVKSVVIALFAHLRVKIPRNKYQVLKPALVLSSANL